jgi:hypothetical protein
MFNILNKYTMNGRFSFIKGDRLIQVSNDVPNLPGVYYFVRITEVDKQIVYIGASGTVDKEGAFSKQLLKKRLNNIQGCKSRQKFLEQKLQEENILEIQIYWFVTFEGIFKDLPGYVEALIIQEYFSEFSKLPFWNNKFPS